ncbi:Ubiquitin carboxyl-terminal hydrolase 36 [Rhizopus azygosporus]|uniref:ubiquitinyl hydrolase 1 n=1 Tax=Rhizopus azygosporus TaxID=86630 RepID=A0A367IZ30_RHIAZ|nr:Ubiquitin carboxyl-terminal hydrolase 36 [Rhizopus azygosporus]
MTKIFKKQNQKNTKPSPTSRFTPFDRSKLQFSWSFKRKIGPGFINMFNTCFLNSVLACLTYTAPLSQYLLTNDHKENCLKEGFCALCAMTEHVYKCFKTFKSLTPLAAISLNYFTSNLKRISSRLTLGRQEDAHEFFMFLLDAFQSSYTPAKSKLTPEQEENGLVHHIFGGKLQSQVTCDNCNAKSNSYDRYLDLSVQLNDAESIEDALKSYIQTDVIGGDNPSENGYNCEQCKQKVKAYKQMTISEIPNNLIIHLKRFEYDFHADSMVKLKQRIRYPTILNMAPYMSEEKHVEKAIYRLYAVLVHQGSTCDSGHYYAYVRNSGGSWYLINDEEVCHVGVKEVMKQQAYMLFYEQKEMVANNKDVTNRKMNKKHQEQKLALTELDLPDELHAKKCLKRSRDDSSEDEAKTKKVKFVEFDDTVVATDPDAWVVRAAGVPHRSLYGNQSPRTYSNAVGHVSQWTVRDC